MILSLVHKTIRPPADGYQKMKQARGFLGNKTTMLLPPSRGFVSKLIGECSRFREAPSL